MGEIYEFIRIIQLLAGFCPSTVLQCPCLSSINCWHIFQAVDAHKSIIFYRGIWSNRKIYVNNDWKWLEPEIHLHQFPFTGAFVPLHVFTRPIPSHRRGPNKWCRVWMDYALVQSMKKSLRQIQVVWQGQKKQNMRNHSGNRTKIVTNMIWENRDTGKQTWRFSSRGKGWTKMSSKIHSTIPVSHLGKSSFHQKIPPKLGILRLLTFNLHLFRWKSHQPLRSHSGHHGNCLELTMTTGQVANHQSPWCHQPQFIDPTSTLPCLRRPKR